jgi:hypothetical protein
MIKIKTEKINEAEFITVVAILNKKNNDNDRIFVYSTQYFTINKNLIIIHYQANDEICRKYLINRRLKTFKRI